MDKLAAILKALETPMGFLSGLKSKRFTVSFAFAFVAIATAFNANSEKAVIPLFALAAAAVIAYVISQTFVDVAERRIVENGVKDANNSAAKGGT
jgi:hypothetical protein